MREELTNLINYLRNNKKIKHFDEAAIKQGVVLKILSTLGWDPFNVDEVFPEYSVKSKRVDYALRYDGHNKVFIEVKKAGENLENCQEQLLNYSFQEGVKLAILTNGISWWFYLPLHEGSWEQRKFYTIEIYDQNIEDIVSKFIAFLSRENVISDKAVANAESIYKSKQRQSLIKKTLPKAWEKLLTEPDELLVELLVEATEKLCGYRPDNETVEKFLAEAAAPTINKFQHITADMRRVSKSKRSLTDNYTGKTIRGFIFEGRRYLVHSWKGMLIKICEIMEERHHDVFAKVLNLVGRKRPYFSLNPNALREPKKIKNTGIYVETNMSANQVVKISREILALFGYDESNLKIEAD